MSKAKSDSEYTPQIKSMLYPLIGARIRQRRHDLHKPLDGIAAEMGIDYTLLSRIERGITTSKNPHLLSATQIAAISQYFHDDAATLIWGTDSEKMRLTKILCLAILVNGNGNPFRDENTKAWIDRQCAEVRAIFQADEERSKKACDFFVNPQNYADYQRLQMRYSEDYTLISNLMLKQLLLDSDYWGCFFAYLRDNSSFAADAFQKSAKEYLLNEGSYLSFLRSEKYYPYFILAFDRYWERVQNEYTDFFENHVFTSSEKLQEKGLREVSNQQFHDAITSHEFIKLNEWSLISAENFDGNSVVASAWQRHTIFAMAHKEDENLFPNNIEEDVANPAQ